VLQKSSDRGDAGRIAAAPGTWEWRHDVEFGERCHSSSAAEENMRRQWPPRGLQATARLATRLERAVDRMNPFLMALAIGLMILNVTCFFAIKVLPPKPIELGAPLSPPATP
jgi:hypothetical protein